MLKRLVILSLLLTAPSAVFAIEMPKTAHELADTVEFNARAYVVADAKTGEVIIYKNPDLLWTPASLTKLVTALVVLDTKPKLSKTVTITQEDQTVGACTSGGACIKAKAGVKFTVDGLFHAALIPSANNAANALARSTGLSQEKFVLKMNEKVKKLGAQNSYFYEPTGMDPNNKITAADFAKILPAVFSNSYLRKVAGLTNYTLYSSNNSKYTQSLKNTDKLLADEEVKILGAKTGYLEESFYNFGALLKNQNGQELAVVVLGEQHLVSAFSETKILANLAKVAQDLAIIGSKSVVLGTDTSQKN